MLRRGVQLSSLLFLVGPHAPRGVDHLWGIGFDACEVGLASREIRLHWKSPPPAEHKRPAIQRLDHGWGARFKTGRVLLALAIDALL